LSNGLEEDHLEERSAGNKRARSLSDVAPVWQDENDEVGDDLGKAGAKVAATDLEQRLRQEYEERNGARPNWAAKQEESASGAAAGLFGTTANVTRAVAGVVLDEKNLKVQKLNNLNVDGHSGSEVEVRFSQTAQVALTAGRDKTLRLFQVNEKKCVKLHSIFFEDLPIKRAMFLPKSNEVLCLGHKKPFYLYDLEGGAVTRVPHLMGQFEDTWADAVPSPDGHFSAFLGGDTGNVVLFSNRTRQIAHTLKMSGAVTCAAFSADGGPYMWTGGPESEIFKWDMRMRRCVNRFRDQGGIGTEAIANSPDGRWQAVGDKSGVVNVYALDKTEEEKGQPHKAIGNLVTAASMLCWNHDSQMLTMASSKMMGALRVAHIPSFHVFPNWPMEHAQLPVIVTSIDISPNSAYMAVGTRKGDAQLHRLLSYQNY
jgi:U3 small nucleolar RNA-associated protein 18